MRAGYGPRASFSSTVVRIDEPVLRELNKTVLVEVIRKFIAVHMGGLNQKDGGR